jgi:hypothetical protein
MKKIYMLSAALLVAGAVSAQVQVVKDGGFQGTFASGAQVGQPNSTNIAGYTLNGTRLDWVGIMKNETTAPITGTQSALIENVDDAVAAAWIGSAPAKTSGFAQQVYKGNALAGKTPSSFIFSYKYRYTTTSADTALVLVNIVDSTLGNAGIIYQGLAFMLNTPSATIKAITTWVNGPAVATGTANRVIIIAASSSQNWFDDVPAPTGSKLILDDVSLVATLDVNVLEASSNVYPNPVQDVLNVEITNAEATSISIYSLTGALVKTENLNGVKGSINVEDLKTGMYMYTISTQGGAVIQSKFLKK